MARVVVEGRGIRMQFGGVRALDRVDFKLRERELRCLIGPNGAGKSTFFKCLAGMQTPTEGTFNVRGVDTTNYKPHQIAALGVGIKTQVPSVMNGLSVRENLWLAARRRLGDSDSKEVVDSTLERVGITAIAGKKVEMLAHGKRQMVEFALVLAMRPWLVLLDEPAAGMTNEEVERAAEIILEINKTSTVMVVEHDMNFVRRIAQRVTVFHQGNVLMEGDAETVLSDARVRDVYLGRAHE